MTSANVTTYVIRKDGIKVGKHEQHCLCKTHWKDLLYFSPAESFTIQATGLDEEEEYWEGEEFPLSEFILKPEIQRGIQREISNRIHEKNKKS